ncbi:Gfo/Idh/MocA family protein [Streptomyces jumonjinensis]|uniref:Gfo/Idh/MocA family oxidoreductase n=1 Tax=Streptomyces jumonjinensis TaxID=1945 RepID=A0A646KI29_STRJU|nr:Gfo/Idh/MocA family oxidoreductase [Streptomyces jumonjinensis]MQT01922.1 Gfo/Idh/MocA family oxidoreductase [Streptomyces jumonjinensis]
MSHPVRNLRFGLFGAGPWAGQTHAPALHAHGGADLVGVWARRPEAAAALAGAHETTAYSGEKGVDELLAVCEAAAFALPPDVQAPLVIRAAAAGRHVLLDKPVATSVALARDTAEAIERAGVASVVFCTLRFAPDTAAWIGEQVAAGGWFTAHARWLGALLGPDADTPDAPSPWRVEKGGLWDVGPHVLSVLIPLLGDVTEVSAVSGLGDTVHMALGHASGASSTATVGLSAPPEAAGASLELIGERGRAVLPRWNDPVIAYRAAVDELRVSIRSGVPHPCDARFGLRMTEILAEAESVLR